MTSKMESGRITISNQAIAKIASHAVQEMHGVTALVEGINKRTDRKKFYKAIGISIEGMELTIDIYPVLLFGSPIHQLAKSLQYEVKQVVEEMTGLLVSAVNIKIVRIQAQD